MLLATAQELRRWKLLWYDGRPVCRYCESNAQSPSGATGFALALLHLTLVVHSALPDASDDSALDRIIYPGKARHATVPKSATEYRQGEPLAVCDVSKRPLFSTGLARV